MILNGKNYFSFHFEVNLHLNNLVSQIIFQKKVYCFSFNLSFEKSIIFSGKKIQNLNQKSR